MSQKKITAQTLVSPTGKAHEVLATGGRNMVGKLCVEHQKPIIDGWLDFPLDRCWCGEWTVDEPDCVLGTRT